MGKYQFATIDIEGTGLNRYKEHITYIGVGLAEDLNCTKLKMFIYDMSKTEDISRFETMCSKLRVNKLKLIWQNGNFDTLFIEQKLGIKLPISDDVMLLGTAYDLGAKHGLKDMAKKYLGVENWDISLKEKTGNSESVIPYLKYDVRYTWGLFQYFMSVLTTEQFKIYKELLKPAYLMYRDVERTGIYIDTKKLKQVKQKYKLEEQEKGKILTKEYDINWNSAPQIQKVLFEFEGLPIIKKSPKTGKPSAGADVLKRLAAQGYELPRKILDHKSSNTLNKMFLNRWEDDAAYDSRVHPSFNLTNVRTGRTSCSDPNLQQVPRTKDVRALFTAPKGRLLFEADYSQLELRLAADYANDKTMLNIFHSGGDIHTETAKTMTNGREPTSEERSKAKALNFGFLYGMSARGFVEYAFNSYGVTFTLAEARLYRELFFAKYSRLLAWHKEQEQLCELLGGVANRFGRFRKLPDIYSTNGRDRSSAARKAINTPVQGTGSDLLIAAATQINKELKPYGVNIVGTIHDSILGEFDVQDEEWVVQEVRRIMCKPDIMETFKVSFKVALEVDIGVGAWGTK